MENLKLHFLSTDLIWFWWITSIVAFPGLDHDNLEIEDDGGDDVDDDGCDDGDDDGDDDGNDDGDDDGDDDGNTVQLIIRGKNWELEGKIEGIIFQNRGQIEGILKGNREQNLFVCVQRFKGPAIPKQRLPSKYTILETPVQGIYKKVDFEL